MRYFCRFFCVAGLLAVFATSPAMAQLSPSGGLGGGAGGGSGPTAPQPRGPAPDVAPPALPGAGDAPGLATGPKLQKTITGDPTTALFAAVNAGNYSDAQDAVSRGADVNAQNALGETPLDLSIALNRNSITFMLLSARNEGGDTAPASGVTPAASMTTPASHVVQSTPSRIAAPARVQASMPGNATGTPNAEAGFLGFGKSQ